MKKYMPKHMRDEKPEKKKENLPDGANIAGVPLEMPPYAPGTEIKEPNSPVTPEQRANYIPQPDGSHIAANGAVIRNPASEQPDVKPDNAYTDDQQDYDILIM